MTQDPDRIDIQKPLYDQKKAFGWTPSPSDDTHQEADCADTPVNDPPRALAGFWMRSLAFLIDGLLLHTVARGWSGAGREFFLDHPQTQIPLAIAIYFAYFALLNGPVGKGQTAGKWLLGLATRRADGLPPDGKIAWARTAIQCAPLTSLWVTDSLFHAFPHPGVNQHTALFYSSILIGVPAFTLLILSASAVAFRPDKRAIHDLLTNGFVCRKGDEAAALDTLACAPADKTRRSWLPVLLLPLVLFGFMQYQTIGDFSEGRAFSVHLAELWNAHGLEGYQTQTPRFGLLSNFALMEGPDDATTAQTDPDAQTPAATTDTVFRLAYPVLYFRVGRVNDDALLATVAEDNLTTAVADWVYARRDHPVIAEPLNELRSQLDESGAQVSCDAVLVQFYEVLRMPWYLGPRYSRLVGEATHDRAIMPLESGTQPVSSRPRSEPYRER